MSATTRTLTQAVPDPGFPPGGGANSWGVEAPTYDFAKFPPKLHEIERIWVPGGGARIPAPPLDPPMQVLFYVNYYIQSY